MRIDSRLTASLSTALLLFAGAAVAGQSSYKVTLTDHHFQPDTVTIPAGQKIALTVENADAGFAEFESYDLNREKIINGNTSVTIYIGPLDPGRYDFFDEIHPQASGQIVVK